MERRSLLYSQSMLARNESSKSTFCSVFSVPISISACLGFGGLLAQEHRGMAGLTSCCIFHCLNEEDFGGSWPVVMGYLDPQGGQRLDTGLK